MYEEYELTIDIEDFLRIPRDETLILRSSSISIIGKSFESGNIEIEAGQTNLSPSRINISISKKNS